MDILVTCPPMLKALKEKKSFIDDLGFNLNTPDVTQIMSEDELINLLPQYDGWIIGDDPATRDVVRAGSLGKLKAAVKWGVGVDNINFDAFNEFSIPINNTPGVFGDEVSDVALGYVIGLARDLFIIDRSVRVGHWIKPAGISIKEKIFGVVGFGDIGKQFCKKIKQLGGFVRVYDPQYNQRNLSNYDYVDEFVGWPNNIETLDFIVLCCALNKSNYHLINKDIFSRAKDTLRIVNVGRGPLIDEKALINALQNESIHSAALDVFENEPLSLSSELIGFERCILGSHNASNSIDAVIKVSNQSLEMMKEMLA